LHVDNDWGAGLVATVTVTNGGTQASSAWQVEVDTSDLIGNVWNGVILSHQGSTYVIANATWNGATPAGGSTSFGFQASETPGAPLSVHLLAFTP
jgi:cellulase/cellobiase CelA1